VPKPVRLGVVGVDDAELEARVVDDFLSSFGWAA